MMQCKSSGGGVYRPLLDDRCGGSHEGVSVRKRCMYGERERKIDEVVYAEVARFDFDRIHLP